MEFVQLDILGLLLPFLFERLKVALVAEVEVLPQTVEERFEHHEVDVLKDGCMMLGLSNHTII